LTLDATAHNIFISKIWPSLAVCSKPDPVPYSVHPENFIKIRSQGSVLGPTSIFTARRYA